MSSLNFNKTACALLALLLASVFFGAFRGMDDPDIWFQLLAGRYALTHGEVPHADFFIYAGHNAPQMFGGWGFGALYEMAMGIFGPRGSTWLNALIWTGAFFCAAKAAALRVQKPLLGLSPAACFGLALACCALCVCIVSRMNMRAESTLFLAWAAALWLFESARAKNRLAMFWLGMPLIAWIEAWLHTGGFVLLALLPIAAAQTATDQGRAFWTLKGIAPWALCLAATILLPILNPNGIEQPYVQLRGMLGLLASNLSGGAGFQNMEYLPAWDPRLAGMRPHFVVLTMIVAAVWARKPTLPSLAEGLVVLAFFAMALLHNRGIGMAALAAMTPLMAQALSWACRQTRLQGRRARALAALFALGPLAVGYSSGRMWQQGSENSLAEAVSIIKAVKPHGAHIFTVESGPQLAYALEDERYLIASGGHLLIDNPAVTSHISRMVGAQADWAGELDREKVDFVCLPLYLSIPDNGIFYWLPSMLATRADWKFYPISGPCSLFARLPAAQKLTPAQLDEQTLLYLQNLKILSSLNVDNASNPDKLGKELMERSQKNIDVIKARMSNARAETPALKTPAQP
jgi:hypothetical protein